MNNKQITIIGGIIVGAFALLVFIFVYFCFLETLEK